MRTRVNYGEYQKVLTKCIDKGAIKFRSLSQCRGLLDIFVESLAQAGPETTPTLFTNDQEKLAFWLNAHNAAALQAAAGNYPMKSKKLPGRPFAENVRVWVDGRLRTLSEMGDLARKSGGNDPRVDLALCWPCKGSGEFLPEVFQANRLGDQLSRLMQRALDNPCLVRVDHERLTLFLGEPIYRNQARYIEIYEKKFGITRATIINALGLYADASQRRRLNTAIGYRVAQTSFDWSINEREEPACSLD
jgi:hypothetical protein